jgi:hypothetical protein
VVCLMCVIMKPRRNEEAQAHIGLSSHRKKKLHSRRIDALIRSRHTDTHTHTHIYIYKYISVYIYAHTSRVYRPIHKQAHQMFLLFTTISYYPTLSDAGLLSFQKFLQAIFSNIMVLAILYAMVCIYTKAVIEGNN